jgi:hypothetical protein
MDAFVVPDGTPQDFVARVQAELSRHGLGGMFSVELAGGEIVARLSRLGTSELRYATAPWNGGFRAHVAARRIFPLHQAFMGSFEEKFASLLESVGARPD